jgi:hypothetical protein
MTVYIYALPARRRHGINDGRNVFVLQFQAVLPSVPAGTSASPVDCMYRDVLL